MDVYLSLRFTGSDLWINADFTWSHFWRANNQPRFLLCNWKFLHFSGNLDRHRAEDQKGTRQNALFEQLFWLWTGPCIKRTYWTKDRDLTQSAPLACVGLLLDFWWIGTKTSVLLKKYLLKMLKIYITINNSQCKHMINANFDWLFRLNCLDSKFYQQIKHLITSFQQKFFRI